MWQLLLLFLAWSLRDCVSPLPLCSQPIKARFMQTTSVHLLTRIVCILFLIHLILGNNLLWLTVNGVSPTFVMAQEPGCDDQLKICYLNNGTSRETTFPLNVPF